MPAAGGAETCRPGRARLHTAARGNTTGMPILLASPLLALGTGIGIVGLILIIIIVIVLFRVL
jgi:hypothetical protein